MDLVGRLKKYMEHVGLPISQFADVAMIPRPTLSQILSGRNKKISNELLEKLHAAFPRLNITWLLFGDGEMDINSLPKVAPQQPAPQRQEPEQKTLAFEQEKVADAEEQKAPMAEEAQNNLNFTGGFVAQQPQQSITLNSDTNKKIQNIMVFYSDNSFAIFRPAQN